MINGVEWDHLTKPALFLLPQVTHIKHLLLPGMQFIRISAACAMEHVNLLTT